MESVDLRPLKSDDWSYLYCMRKRFGDEWPDFFEAIKEMKRSINDRILTISEDVEMYMDRDLRNENKNRNLAP